MLTSRGFGANYIGMPALQRQTAKAAVCDTGP
jgi:hypothetical protein